MPQLFTALQISQLDKIKDWWCLPNNTIVAKHFTHVYFVLIILQILTICAIKTLHTQVSHTIYFTVQQLNMYIRRTGKALSIKTHE